MPTDADWERWLRELPGGELTEDEAMQIAREARDEVRAEARKKG